MAGCDTADGAGVDRADRRRKLGDRQLVAVAQAVADHPLYIVHFQLPGRTGHNLQGSTQAHRAQLVLNRRQCGGKARRWRNRSRTGNNRTGAGRNAAHPPR